MDHETSSFKFDEIVEVGPVSSAFTATVSVIEDKELLSSGTPYLRVMLTQDGGTSMMVALAIGSSYKIAKNKYKVGEEYTFPAVMFRTKLRKEDFESWSTYKYDLWFINAEDKNVVTKSERMENKSTVESVQNVPRTIPETTSSRFGNSSRGRSQISRADADNDWRRK